MATLCVELAKVVISTLPSASLINRSKLGRTELSDGTKPGTSEFVESERRQRTPFSP